MESATSRDGRPATTQMTARRKYLNTPTHRRVKNDFKKVVRQPRTAPLERVRAKARRKRRKENNKFGQSYNAKMSKFDMTSQILPKPGRHKKKLSKVKGHCAMCSMKRSAFSDFCDRCALKLRVSRAENVKASRKAWVRSGRAATFMLELSEDDVAVTRLSFKEAKVLSTQLFMIPYLFCLTGTSGSGGMAISSWRRNKHLLEWFSHSILGTSFYT